MSQQEYTIHIFGQDLTSQDGLFRLDEIRRVGIQIGTVADGNSTEVRRFARTNVGRYLMGPKSGRIKKVDMGRLGTSWLADPTSAVKFGEWLDFEYGIAVADAFVSMTSSATVQAAVASSDDISPDSKSFIKKHTVSHYRAGQLVSKEEFEELRVGRCEWRL
ncbi:hypothetical protein OGW15_17305 [Citrobacter sp. Cf039]|uniref:Uncharacterized protein n=3 Tax=Enterobacteriaceae TaxID=543 RepID=A0AAI9MLN0_CITFR|nr:MULTISPECIES: hypothetical protein [Enterobacteriaceae]EKV7199114.1 hypothetical protein [Citrobacter freundii]EKW4406564.1 hypothetical protein [Citrobacter freundii]EKX8775875.1 hypothetical protein [Citrobacter freundii]ELF4151224.1 hypothetical protein [Citrobacter freundii]ELJ5790172.1 hypothetical protein [Citrobacter freundii]